MGLNRVAAIPLALALLLVGVVLVARNVHQSMVFAPQHLEGSIDGYARRTGARVIRVAATDGTQLSGLLFENTERTGPYIIFLYGNADLCANETPRLQWLSQSLGYSSVCFDYRGYGLNSGTPDSARIRADVISIYDYVRDRLDKRHREPYVYGWSLGTQFAIHVAATRKVRGLIFQAPVASAREEVAFQGTQVLGSWASIVRPRPDANVERLFQGKVEIASVRAPLLVLHGTADQVVPLAQGREVFDAAASSEKRFVAVAGADHNDLMYYAPPGGPAIERFLRTYRDRSR